MSREPDRELDLERVRMYFELNKDLKVAWLVGALVPSLIAIFVITESWSQTQPYLAIGTDFLVLAVVVGFLIDWYKGLSAILALVEENLRTIQEGKPVTLSPPPLRSGLLKWAMKRSKEGSTPSDPPSPSPSKDGILDRMRDVDKKFSVWKNSTIWIWGFAGTMLLLLAVLLGIQTSSATGTQLQILLAVDLASFSFIFQYFEFFIRRLRSWTVDANYRRLKKQKHDLVTQALIMMKYEAPTFNLEEAYQLNPALFTKEALIERVYRK